MSAAATLIEVPPGLKGVAAARTAIGDVRGREGFFHYREHDAIRLAESRRFEEVWYLLHRGELPGAAELAAFQEELGGLRDVPELLRGVLPGVAGLGGAPLAGLRAAYAALVAAERFAPWLDLTEGELRRQALHTCAVFPVLVATLHRLARGERAPSPDPELGHAANYLRMLTGESPAPERARALEQYLTSTVDHGLNASTFAARVVTSTGADLGSAVLGALGALSGPLHGGAPSRALDMLDAIGTPERAEAWLRAALERGERLMGFGHAVYRTEDPRSRLLKRLAGELGGPRVELARHVEERALALLRELRPGRELHANVEFYAALVLEAVGIPRELFTSTFAVSRVVGWTAHVLEQAADNEIIRPSARYVGPAPT